jgi:DNA-binding SARP family transcriptional activator
LGGDSLSVDPTVLSSDVQSFCAAHREGRLQDALEFVTDDFLADFHVPDGGQFMAWADDRRRSLKDMAVDAARRLAREAETALNLYQAVAWWRRALELAPYDERILVDLVWALARSGNRGGAQEAYRSFRGRMLGHLELEPSLTTQAAVEQALRTTGSSAVSRGRGDHLPLREPRWLGTAVGYQADE